VGASFQRTMSRSLWDLGRGNGPARGDQLLSLAELATISPDVCFRAIGFLHVENPHITWTDLRGVTLYKGASNCRDSHALPSIFKRNVSCSPGSAPQPHE
jgi:hypothetical protein